MSRPGKVRRGAAKETTGATAGAGPRQGRGGGTGRPDAPGGRRNAGAPEATPQGHNLQIDIVYSVDYQGI